MREPRKIVERWHEGSASILATLVRVQGSSYRQPGARLMVCHDGTYEGSLTAGCLEADLLRKAAWLIRNGATIERYSTMFDEASEMPYGLGCGGVLDVLLERVESPECQALLEAMQAVLSGHERLIATWLPADGGAMMRAVFRADGEVIFASKNLSSESLSRACVKCLCEQNSEVDGVFIERLLPPQRLFLFGAGDDAKPLVTMADQLGWQTTVIDGRSHLARKDRFPEKNVEVVTDANAAICKINTHDAIVIMTHSYAQDKEYLASVLPLRPRYIGLLGSRQRSSLLIADVAARLEISVARCCEHICAPVGLDIGGDGPQVIALAIIAEVQACCSGKGSTSRKLSAAHVNRYLADGNAQIYRQAQCALETA